MNAVAKKMCVGPLVSRRMDELALDIGVVVAQGIAQVLKPFAALSENGHGRDYQALRDRVAAEFRELVDMFATEKTAELVEQVQGELLEAIETLTPDRVIIKPNRAGERPSNSQSAVKKPAGQTADDRAGRERAADVGNAARSMAPVPVRVFAEFLKSHGFNRVRNQRDELVFEHFPTNGKVSLPNNTDDVQPPKVRQLLKQISAILDSRVNLIKGIPVVVGSTQAKHDTADTLKGGLG